MSKIKFDERFATHPKDLVNYSTERLREEFLIEQLFITDEIKLTYTGYDRFISGGAVPVSSTLSLDAIDPLKADNFCDRREVGIINIGGAGTVTVDGVDFNLDNRDAIYIGKGATSVLLKSDNPEKHAIFYINSAPAHHSYPTKKISKADTIKLELGTVQEANKRVINQYIVRGTVETCQLQMGITSLQEGSVWNTIPPHTHNRRMEVYLYTDLNKDQAICHYMGEAENTRHIWMGNNQAVISPAWSIHSAVGTSNYSFIWGMAGENLDFTDMDVIKLTDLR